MSAYALHTAGDCWPDTCPLCAAECADCGNWHHEGTCTDDEEDET